MESLEKYWEVITWIAGGFGAIFTLLLSAIVYLIYTDKKESKETLQKHEGWILKQQESLHEWGMKTNVAIELIKQEQQQGWKRLEIFEEHFFKAEKKKK
jgi:hypothetical protein